MAGVTAVNEQSDGGNMAQGKGCKKTDGNAAEDPGTKDPKDFRGETGGKRNEEACEKANNRFLFELRFAKRHGVTEMESVMIDHISRDMDGEDINEVKQNNHNPERGPTESCMLKKNLFQNCWGKPCTKLN